VRTDRLSEAETSYETALPIFRQIEAHLGVANTLQGMGAWALAQARTTQAVEWLQDARRIYVAIDEKIGQINCAMRLSEAFLAQEKADVAIRQVLEALLLGLKINIPQIEIIFRRLSNVWLHVGTPTFEAAGSAKMAELRPEDREMLEPVFQEFVSTVGAASDSDRAELLLRAGEISTAEALLSSLAEAEPTDLRTWALLAKARFRLGAYTESLSAYEKLRELDPEDASAPGAMGWIYYLLGDYDASVAHSRAALELDPDATWIRCDLGLAMLQLGRIDAARQAYLEAVAAIGSAAELERLALKDLDEALADNPDLPGGEEILRMLLERQAALPEE